MSGEKGEPQNDTFANASSLNNYCTAPMDTYFPFPIELKAKSNVKTVYQVPKSKEKTFIKRKIFQKNKLKIKVQRMLHLDYRSAELLIGADKAEIADRRKAAEIAKVEASPTESNMIRILCTRGEPLIIFSPDGEQEEVISEIMKFIDSCHAAKKGEEK